MGKFTHMMGTIRKLLGKSGLYTITVMILWGIFSLIIHSPIHEIQGVFWQNLILGELMIVIGHITLWKYHSGEFHFS